MRRILFATTLVATFIAGCVAASVGATSSPAMAAEPAPGERDCFGIVTWVVKGAEFNKGTLPPKQVRLPANYEVVGGGSFANSGEALMLVCSTTGSGTEPVSAPTADAPEAAAPPAAQ